MEAYQMRVGQLELIRRIRQLVHWVKGDIGYHGPTDTDEFSSIALEKLVRRSTYNRVLRTEPGKLRGLLRWIVRHVVIDRIRYEEALRRKTPRPEPAAPPRPTPSFHSEMDRQQRIRAIRVALEKAATDDGPHRIGAASKRGPMLEAFELRWRGLSHREIARRLQVSKGTVGYWLDNIKEYVRRELGEHSTPS